jgi:acyl-CoA synthetase (AMP-forming)/AMP-acid ligase II
MAVDKLKRCLEVFGQVMTQFWGQTEAPIFCTALTVEDHDVANVSGRLASCGRPMLLTEVAVMDDDGNLVPDHVRGELVVRGNLVMLRYHKNEAATREASAFDWHHTGDVGYRDANGYFYIVDRKKDMIISGGYNVYPNEVEQVILSHPAIIDCAVIGVPHEIWGEQVTAIVATQPQASVSSEEIIALCKRSLGSVYAPKAVEFWNDLPRTAVGKVDKRSIRDTFWAGQARAV